MVMVHGYTGSSDDFADAAAPLRDTRRIVLVDQLGHGASPRRTAYSLDDLVAAITHTLEDMNYPVDLLGHSMGGRTVLPIAIDRPDLVASLILMDTWADPPLRTLEEDRMLAVFELPDHEALAALAAQPAGPPSSEDDLILAEWGAEWVEAHRAANTAADPLAVIHLGREMFGHDRSLLSAAASISCPTTVIVGELDTPFVPTSQRMARVIPDAVLSVVPGAYHSPQLTHPEEWRTAIRQHLARSARGIG